MIDIKIPKPRQRRQPSGCIEEHPNRKSLCLAGKWINVTAIARSQGLNKGTVSRILSGQRPNPTLLTLQKIGSAIGMEPEELMLALEERYALIKSYHTELEIQYLTRITDENEQDIATILRGKPVVPRMPGSRIPVLK